MKPYLKILNLGAIAALAAMIFVSGCGGKAGGAIDTRPLEKAFSSAEPAIKTVTDKAIADIKAQDYGAVVVELSQIASNEKLTPEQQQLLREVIAKAQKIVAASPPKTVDRLPMAMPK